MATTYLSFTPSSTGNQRTFTFSFWVQRSKLGLGGTGQVIYCQSYGSDGYQFKIEFTSNDEFRLYNSKGASDAINLKTSKLFRDTSSWYAITVEIDTTQSTESDRAKIYVNGVQETAFGTSTYPTQNLELDVNAAAAQIIGAKYSGSYSTYFDGLLSQFIFVDGTAYAASTFGSTNTVSGEWKPNANPTVTYGSNGYKLTFEDTTALGDDTSGNTNDFTLSGSGTSTLDNPSNNFATWNPLNYVQANNSPVLTNGNTKMTGSADAPFPNAISTLGIPKSGKYYAEFKMQNNTAFAVGICDIPKGMEALRTASTSIYNTSFNGAVSLKNDGSVIRNGAETNSVTPTIATGDIAMIAYDADNGAFYAGRNGTWGTVGGVVGVPTSGSSKTGAIDISAQSWFTTSTDQGFLVGSTTGGGYAVVEANFGNGYFGTTAVTSAGTAPSTPGTFEYAVPTSYQPLSTKGLNV